ncbi:MAG: hypothetical protein Q9186_004623 [Xanthomendoza sp. 1 TL-2023]
MVTAKTNFGKGTAHTDTAGSSVISLTDRPHAQLNFGIVGAATGPHLSTNVAIEPITPATVPSFRRIIGLLLPIRYPDKFFAESVANVTPSSLARAATWHERTRPAKRKREELSLPEERDSNPLYPPLDASNAPGNSLKAEEASGIVVGGIQCRMEQLPYHPSLTTSSRVSDGAIGSKNYCYIQTLALLSPYRSKGIATALLEAIITTLCLEHCYTGTTSIYAHVWEENEEALEWYSRRGFHVSREVLKGYYRRLKPDGARVVWRDLGVNDHLRCQSKASKSLTHDEDTGYIGGLATE